MLTNFRHKGLEEFWTTGASRHLQSDVQKRIKIRLDVMELAETLQDINAQGWGLHELTGERKGTWSLWVNAAWRITFRYEEGQCLDVDFEQYH